MEPLEVLFNLLEPVVDHHLDPPGSAHQDLSNNLGLVDLEEDLEVLRMDHRLEAHLALVVLASMDRLEVEVDVAEEGGEEEGDQMVLSGVDLTWDSEDEVDLEEEGVASEDPQVLKLKKLIQKRKISSFLIQIARSIFLRLYLMFQDIGMMDRWMEERLLEDPLDLEGMKADLIILTSKFFLSELYRSLVQTFCT